MESQFLIGKIAGEREVIMTTITRSQFLIGKIAVVGISLISGIIIGSQFLIGKIAARGMRVKHWPKACLNSL